MAQNSPQGQFEYELNIKYQEILPNIPKSNNVCRSVLKCMYKYFNEVPCCLLSNAS